MKAAQIFANFYVENTSEKSQNVLLVDSIAKLAFLQLSGNTANFLQQVECAKTRERNLRQI